MDNIVIRKVDLNDLEALQQVGKEIFKESFSDSTSEENMTKYLEEGFAIEKLHQEVSNTASQFYFAVLGDEVIGYLKLNSGAAQTELKDEQALEIERIYVRSAYHGRKVGQLLYQKAMLVTQEMKLNYIWLGVWEQNLKAIKFYQKNGFVEFDRHIFKLGNDEQTDIMMKKIL